MDSLGPVEIIFRVHAIKINKDGSREDLGDLLLTPSDVEKKECQEL